MNKHTPGPWFVDNAFDGDVRGEYGDVAIAVYRDMVRIEVCGQPSLAQISREEAQANARLIAAAPELLRAAQEALSDFRFIERVDPSANFKASILLIENAIAKATGAA